VPSLLLLLALPLLLADCSGDDAASSSGSLTGEWTPEKGALTLRASSGSEYEFDPKAASPAGGLIVVENGGTYRVTLVSADGDRFLAGAAVRQDDMLLVRIGSKHGPSISSRVHCWRASSSRK
jgi:hypothetical protein